MWTVIIEGIASILATILAPLGKRLFGTQPAPTDAVAATAAAAEVKAVMNAPKTVAEVEDRLNKGTF